jgi:hypothetical protein
MFGGGGPNTPPIQITQNIQTMDGANFAEFAKQHAEMIADATGLALQQGRAGTLPRALENA